MQSERFYFVHSYAVQDWALEPPSGAFAAVAPKVTWADHGGPLVAAVENGPLSATQFHPRSPATQARLLETGSSRYEYAPSRRPMSTPTRAPANQETR